MGTYNMFKDYTISFSSMKYSNGTWTVESSPKKFTPKELYGEMLLEES